MVGSFFASDNTCEICQAGYQSSCINGKPIGAVAAEGYKAMDERRAIKVLLRP